MKAQRIFLGGDRDIGSRRKIFLIDDAIEVDEIGFTDIERTRVFFDDALALTYHREYGAGFLFGTGIMWALMAMCAVLIYNGSGRGSEGAAIIFFLMFGFPFLVAFLLRAMLRVDIITLYGNRSKAKMRFSFRKTRAREVYADLARRIKRKQAQIAATIPPPPPPPEPPLPPWPGAIPG